jgi:CheY-like chemotaxis protein
MGRILVADDHADLVELLQTMLEGEGYTVDAVLGGQGALELLGADCL